MPHIPMEAPLYRQPIVLTFRAPQPVTAEYCARLIDDN